MKERECKQFPVLKAYPNVKKDLLNSLANVLTTYAGRIDINNGWSKNM